MSRGRCAALGALAGLLLAAGAAAAGPAVVVVEFSGAKPRAVRERVVAALEKAGAEIKADGAPSPGDDERSFARAAEKHGAGAVVSGHVELAKNRWRLTLTVRDGRGVVQAEKEIAAPWLPGLLKAIDKKAARELEPILDAAGNAGAAVELEEEQEQAGEATAAEERMRGAATAEEDGAGDEPATGEAGPAAGDPRTDEGGSRAGSGEARNQSALELQAAARVVSRSFDYSGDVNRALLRYGLDGAPAVAVGASWYPGAHFTEAAGRHVGLVGTFEQSFAMESKRTATGGPSYSSTLQAFSVGVRGRIPLASHEVGVTAAYGSQRFSIDGDRAAGTPEPGLPAPAAQRDLLPDVAYSFLRPGLDAALRFGRVSVTGSTGYRHVLDAGALASEAWFPRATASGFDASLAVGYEVAPRLDLLVGGELRLYAIDTGARAADATLGRPIAEGAADRYLAGLLGLSWSVPGG